MANIHGTKQHGLSRTPEWYSWQCMRSRCYYQKDREWPNYGGRGIVVCERWRNDFLAFLQDMGARPPGATLERLNTNGHYCPENCRWATPAEQAHNRRNNIFVTLDGVTLSVMEWAACTGLKYQTIYWRMRRGWKPEAILARRSEAF